MKPVVTPGDRLGLTICVAIIIHTMIVMGVSFTPEPVPESRFESLEVILVTQKSEKPPEDADMLAQANFQGGGNSETVERPSAPVEAPIPAPTPDVAATPAPNVEQQVQQKPDPQAWALGRTRSSDPIEKSPQRSPFFISTLPVHSGLEGRKRWLKRRDRVRRL